MSTRCCSRPAAEDLRRTAGVVGDSCSGDLRLVLVAVTPATTTLPRLSPRHDPGPFGVVEARADVDRDAVLHPNLHAADLQHLGAERRELEHLFVADARDLARRRADVRVGRVDAVDVGVDLADVGADRGGDGDGGGVASRRGRAW